MDDVDHGPVRFDGSDLATAVALLRAHASPPDQITAWVDLRPLEVPPDLLATKKGLLGRAKRVDPPSAQVVWVDPATGPTGSTITIELPGVDVAAVVEAAGPAPAGWRVEGAPSGVIVSADSGPAPEELVGYAVGALAGAVPGWQGPFEATGIDGTDYGGQEYV